jgi:zinc/manganese transport system permease protein
MNEFATQVGLLWPAFAAGLIVLATHVPLGMQVLARGIIFIDLAVAQVAGLGALAAHLADHGDNPWVVQGAALGAALAAALLLQWSERRWPQLQEALIGLLFVLAASGTVLLLSRRRPAPCSCWFGGHWAGRAAAWRFTRCSPWP